MKLHEAREAFTVGQLKALIANLPDGMEVAKLQSGNLLPLKVSIQVRGKSNARRIVSRGGVPFLAFPENW